MASPHPEHDLERGFGRPPHAVPHLLFYFGDQSSGEALFVDSSSSKNLLFWLVYSPMNIWLQFRICSERAGEMRSTLLTFVCPAAGGSSQRQSLALCSSGPSPATAPLIWCYDCITGHRQMNLLSRRSNRMSYALIDSPGASIISTFFLKKTTVFVSTQKMQVFVVVTTNTSWIALLRGIWRAVVQSVRRFDPILTHAFFFWVAGSVDLAWISGAKPG